MKNLLQLGRLSDLCWYEAKQSFEPEFELQKLSPTYVSVETDSLETLTRILDKTAGIIKAFSVIDQKNPGESFIDEIVADLVSDHRSDFSVFFQPGQDSLSQMKEIKTKLKEHGLSGRYVTSQSHGLSASILRHHRVNEYGVVQIGELVYLLKTCWVQNIDHWSIKDIDKPNRDPEKGMLPPKLARTMINFLSPGLKSQETKRLYDPFCGTGTILIEGSELGWSVIGSDISQVSVNQSGENLHWFTQYKQIEPQYSLFCSDATQVSSAQLQGKVDAIVTEPFLGKQQPKPDQLPNVFKGLEKLYWGALKRWTQLLNEKGEVVLVTPLVSQGDKTYSLAKMIDKSRELGYSILSGPLTYSREQTVVQRAIYHLKYNP
ncbi:MAG: hypothetical protein ABI425_00545 [Patescibacteria group bacterium]